MTHYMKSNRYGSPTRQYSCPECNSLNFVGSLPNYTCLNCGKSFQSFKSKKNMHIYFRKKPDKSSEKIRTEWENDSKSTKSRLSNIECPTSCPVCESTKTTKEGNIYQCRSCGYFDKVEVFEGDYDKEEEDD